MHDEPRSRDPSDPRPERRLLGLLRARWVDQAYPLVLRVDRDGMTTACAAPSLWMAAREVAAELRGAGLQPGQVVHYTGPEGPEWIWALIGTIRARACFCAGPSPEARASWSVDGARHVRSEGPPRPGPGVGVIVRGDRRSRFVPIGAWPLRPPRAPSRAVVDIRSAWHRADVFLDRLLPALVDGAEIVCGDLPAA